MKKVSLIIFLTLISIIVSVLAWDNILLPYDNKNQIYGEFFKLKYNPANDTFRYIFFVLFPLITFLTSYKFLYKENLFTIKEVLNFKATELEEKKSLDFFLYLILILAIFSFLSLDFENSYYLSKLDFYHEGTTLTPSKNFYLTNGFWTSTFIEYGLFGNFYPVFVWKIFNHETIGSLRFFAILTLLFNNILLVLISKKIAESLNLDKIYKVFYFVILSIIAMSLIDYKYSHTDIPAKFSLILLFLYIFIYSMPPAKSFININFLVGVFSATSLFWYIDVGAYLNLLIIAILIYLALRKEYKKVFLIISGILAGWMLFLGLIPTSETAAFYENTKSIFSTVGYIDGLVYPTPFISNDARSTKALVLIILTGILLIIFNLSKKTKTKYKNKVFFSFLYFMNILIFGSAIVRSDSPHIKSSSGLFLFLFAAITLYFIFRIVENFDKKNELFKEGFVIIKKYFFLIASIIIIINFTLISEYPINLKKLFFSPETIKKLIVRDNKNYLSKDHIEMINYYSDLIKEEKCVQIFTNESAIPYFLNKPTCSKFYSMTMAADIKSQKFFIKELIITKPKIILVDSDESSYNDTKYRLPLVLNFIESNYSFHSNFKFWRFVQLKQ